MQLEDLIADEQVAVTVSHQGYLKRTPISIYRQQRRGGTGRTGMKTREEDFVSQLIVDSTHAYLLCFTNTGRVYWLKVYEIPDVGAAGKGKSMQSLLNLQPGENVRTILPVRDLEEEGKYIFFATRNGTVKKTPLKDFSNVMSRGIIAIAIDKDDDLIAADHRRQADHLPRHARWHGHPLRGGIRAGTQRNRSSADGPQRRWQQGHIA